MAEITEVVGLRQQEKAVAQLGNGFFHRPILE
jgi:hypothetical protein